MRQSKVTNGVMDSLLKPPHVIPSNWTPGQYLLEDFQTPARTLVVNVTAAISPSIYGKMTVDQSFAGWQRGEAVQDIPPV